MDGREKLVAVKADAELANSNTRAVIFMVEILGGRNRTVWKAERKTYERRVAARACVDSGCLLPALTALSTQLKAPRLIFTIAMKKTRRKLIKAVGLAFR